MIEKSRHVVSYEILNMQPDEPPRVIEVHANHDELLRLADEGYLVRESFFKGDKLNQLRSALDRVEDREFSEEKPTLYKDFGGFTITNLMDKDEEFLHLVYCQPMISVARAMMGPQIQMNVAGRITYPGKEGQRTIWHHHLRYIPKPLPPWFTRPHCLNVLVYLDDVTEENGPLCVVPGSHHRIQDEPSADYFGDLPGQQTLYPTSGTAVFMHSTTWHMAKTTTDKGTKRRLLILNFFPSWLRRRINENRPQDGLTQKLADDTETDSETLELLGRGGYM